MKRLVITLQLIVYVVFTDGCIKVPAPIIVDRKTALEEQAAGRFTGLDSALEQAGVAPGPVPYTRGELERAGGASAASAEEGRETGELARGTAASDAELVDDLLLRRCLGEALDGTLADTPKTCASPIDGERNAALLERQNRRRYQVWSWLARTTHRPLDEVRLAWRKTHLESVICGAPIERPDHSWDPKKC